MFFLHYFTYSAFKRVEKRKTKRSRIRIEQKQRTKADKKVQLESTD